MRLLFADFHCGRIRDGAANSSAAKDELSIQNFWTLGDVSHRCRNGLEGPLA